jgi:succinoglycan biosynthesis transport protein ExoP
VRQANLRRESAQLEKKIEAQNQASANMRALMAEVDANKKLFQTVPTRFKETKVDEDELQQADARIISPAKPPDGPFYPQKKLIILAALMVSAMFGIGIAIALELMDNGYRSLNHLEQVTGVPGLGIVPLLDKNDESLLPHEAAIRHPNSPCGESVRSIQTGLLLSNADAPPEKIMFTSAVSAAGKSSTSLSIAALSARTGQRTIIIDCDMRHPSVYVGLGVSNTLGLRNCLSGQYALDEIIYIDLASGAHYITAGGRTPHPTHLLSSQQMKVLLALLSQQYDLVVIDTPPLLAVSDTLVLALQVEKTAFVVRWQKTRRETVVASLRQLIDADEDIASTVMTQVDLKKQARYGQSDSGYRYYYARHMKYYTE